MTAPEILAVCRSRGVELTIAGGALRFRAPAGAVDPALRAELAARKAEVLAYLAGPPWDAAAAVRLQIEADELVEQLGVDGRHPDIQVAAGRVCDAHRRRDMAAVREACAEVMEAAHRLAGPRGSGARRIPRRG